MDFLKVEVEWKKVQIVLDIELNSIQTIEH